MKHILLTLALVLASVSAHAQTNPDFVPGTVLHATTLNSAFASKADATNGTLTNPTLITPKGVVTSIGGDSGAVTAAQVAAVLNGQTITLGAITANGGLTALNATILSETNGAVYYPTGAAFDGTTDDTTAIQAVINKVDALPHGGIIQFPCATAVISSTIVVSSSNVHLKGCGVGLYWAGSTGVQGGTEFKWAGANGGTMVKMAPVAGATSPLYSTDAQGIILNGALIAGVGWDLASIRNGVWNIGFAHQTTEGVILDTENVSGSPSFQGNDLTILGDVRDTGAIGVLAQDSGTPGIANVSLNLFRKVIVTTNTGWGMRFVDSDNNRFNMVDLLSIASPSYGLDLQAPHGAGGDHFEYLNTNGGQILVESNYTDAWFDILDGGNSTPAPTVLSNAYAWYQMNSGVTRSVIPNMSYNCGTYAITADIANGTNAGCRGNYAVDFQQQRVGVGQVAAGLGAILLGYSNNQVNGVGTVSLGYTWNNCSSNYALCLGSYTVSQFQAGSIKNAPAQLVTGGDMQEGWQVLGIRTADASAHRLTSDGTGTVAADNCLNLQPNTAYAVQITLLAYDTTTAGNRLAETYPLALYGQDANAASTYLTLGTPTILSAGTVGTFALAADTAAGCMIIVYTAPNTDTWKAVARVTSVETHK